MYDKERGFTVPKWSSRKGKIFYVRLILLLIGIIILSFTLTKADNDISIEIAALFMGIAIGTVVSDAISFLTPCKKLTKE